MFYFESQNIFISTKLHIASLCSVCLALEKETEEAFKTKGQFLQYCGHCWLWAPPLIQLPTAFAIFMQVPFFCYLYHQSTKVYFFCMIFIRQIQSFNEILLKTAFKNLSERINYPKICPLSSKPIASPLYWMPPTSKFNGRTQLSQSGIDLPLSDGSCKFKNHKSSKTSIKKFCFWRNKNVFHTGNIVFSRVHCQSTLEAFWKVTRNSSALLEDNAVTWTSTTSDSVTPHVDLEGAAASAVQPSKHFGRVYSSNSCLSEVLKSTNTNQVPTPGLGEDFIISLFPSSIIIPLNK